MIKAIIWDIGRVVWDYKPFQEKLYENLARASGNKTDKVKRMHRKFYKVMETDSMSLRDWANKLRCSNDEAEAELKKSFYENYDKYINQEALELVRQIKDKLEVVFLSNIENYLGDLYRESGLIKDFEWGVFSYEAKTRKPERAIFELILKKGGWGPEEVIFIDDKTENIKAAEEMGITAWKYKGIKSIKPKLRKMGLVN
jgi:HAD superfamily hydrolase (TIGR01509 family)